MSELAIVGLDAAVGALGDRAAVERAIYRGAPAGEASVEASVAALGRRLAAGALADAGLADAGLADAPAIAVVEIAGRSLDEALGAAAERLAGGAGAVLVVQAEAEAGAAVVLADAESARAAGRPIYASVGVGEAGGWRAGADAAGEGGRWLEYAEVDAEADLAPLARGRAGEPSCAVGSGPGGLLALVKVALCLRGRYLPAAPGWTRLLPDGLFAPADSRPWLVGPGARRRAVVVQGRRWIRLLGEPEAGLPERGQTGSMAGAGAPAPPPRGGPIGECSAPTRPPGEMPGDCGPRTPAAESARSPGTRPRATPSVAERPVFGASAMESPASARTASGAPGASLWPIVPIDELHLLTLTADEPGELLGALEGLAGVLEGDADLAGLARATREGVGRRRLTAALLGRSRAELRAELAAARQGIPPALARGGDWRTPRGSAFAARPLGREGAVAFVYPGAFSAYVGVGRDLFRLLPWAAGELAARCSDPAAALHERLIYPRTTGRPSIQAQAALDRRLAGDALAMMQSGMVVAALQTLALRGLGVEPRLAFGYSLGEVTMLFALGVWPAGDAAYDLLASSHLFTTRLVGRKEAVRDEWRLGPDEPLAWEARVLLAGPAAVEAAMAGLERVYLTIVNTPGEVVIAGDPAATAEVARRLACQSVAAPFDHVLHCRPVERERGELARVLSHPASPARELAFYSAAESGPLATVDPGLAGRLAAMASQRLDFPALVERLYAAGARVFVELGPGGTTTRLLQACLGEREHVALPLVRRGVDDQTGLYRAVASLLAHGVAVKLEAL